MGRRMKHSVYFVQASGKRCAIKIGMARNVAARVAELQTANHETLSILVEIPCDSEKEAFDLEQRLHRLFRRHRIRGEWFEPKIMSRMWVLNSRWAKLEKTLTA
jgi:predicted GIY-YIG superfamily endonuclease